MTTTIEAIQFHGVDALCLQVKGASAVVSLLGGQVLSWQTPDGRERLYLSPQAVFDGSQPIRGGIPVCFPQFGNLGQLPKHGLVRTARWQVEQRRSGPDYALVTLAVTGGAPSPWRCEITVMLEENRLDVELGAANTGTSPFHFTAALHTYLRATQVEDVALEGLYGCLYRDALEGDRMRKETSPKLTLEGETDRVYHDVSRTLLLHGGNLSAGVDAQGFPDVVLWNPWQAGCARLADMPADGWRHMLCVEAAVIGEPVCLAGGEEWSGRQSLVAV